MQIQLMNRLASLILSTGLLLSSVAGAAHDFEGADDLTAEGKRLLENIEQTYRALDYYEDRAVGYFDANILEGGDDFFGPDDLSEQIVKRLVIAAPNRVAFITEDMSLHSDGNHVWIAMPSWSQYVKREAPESFAGLVMPDDMFVSQMIMSHPVMSTLIGKSELFQDQRPELIEVKEIRYEDGEVGREVYIKSIYDYSAHDLHEPVVVEVWIDAESKLYRRVRVDLTDAYNTMFADMAQYFDDSEVPVFELFVYGVDLHDVKVNEVIPDERFVFSPRDGDEEVESFMPSFSPGPNQQVMLVGHEAPDFTLPTLDGKELALSDLRGQVVLLDFWAMWCGPCVAALPHIQKIAEKFAGWPVTVVGVNRDPHGSEDRLKDFLSTRNVTFTQALDFDGDVAQLYHVRGIPCTVLIDANGVVQEVGSGLSPGKADEIADSIEKLLAGETLYDEEEIRELQERIAAGEFVDEWDMGFDGPDERQSREAVQEAIRDTLGNVPERLAGLDSPRTAIQGGWSAQRIDVNGDGHLQLVIPDHQGGLVILNHDGSEVERVQFQGLGRNAHIENVEFIAIGESRYWLISTNVWGRARQTTAVLGMYDETGNAVWTFEPSFPDNISFDFDSLSVGDVAGNGVPEVVVLLDAYQVVSRGQEYWMHHGQHSHLVILDLQGDVIAQRSAGRHASAVTVAEPIVAGEPAVVMFIGDGRVRRFYFDVEVEQSSP